MELTIKIEGLQELANAINNFAGVFGNARVKSVIMEEKIQSSAKSEVVDSMDTLPFSDPVDQQPVQPVQQIQQVQPMQPVQQTYVPPQQMQGIPINQPVQQQQAVVTQQPFNIPTTATAQEYTQDQLAVAMTGLVDAGKREVLTQILQRFGAQSLLQLPKERYPEAVLALREAGANI